MLDKQRLNPLIAIMGAAALMMSAPAFAQDAAAPAADPAAAAGRPQRSAHWLVRMNHRNRSLCFMLLGATMASHMADIGYGNGGNIFELEPMLHMLLMVGI